MLPTVSQHQALGFTFIFQTQRSNGNSSGTDPGFQVRGAVLKKIVPSGGRLENCCGISCEKSRFYAKKYFFLIAEGGAKMFVVFSVKNHDFTPKKIIFFPILGGGGGEGAPGAPPTPWVRHCSC